MRIYRAEIAWGWVPGANAQEACLATTTSLAILVESPQVESQMTASVVIEMKVFSNRDNDVVVSIRVSA